MPTTRLDLAQLPGVSPLVRDYATAFSRLAPFYAHDPHDPAAARTQADRCAARDYPRAALQAALRAQNQGWGAPEPVLRNLEALGRPDCLAVLTGQQTGLFGGPLFTLYKALTTVRLAAQWQAELGRPVVPLFWLAAEDHDVAEADHVILPDPAGTLVTIRHEAWGAPPGFMPANLPLGAAVAETLVRARACLPATEFLPPLWEALAEAYAPEATLAEAFARWMTFLLGRTGLVLVDAADPRLKRAGAAVFQQELAEAPRASQAILEASHALREAGYPAQIEARPDGVSCFLLRDGRHPLVRDGGSFRLRDTGLAIPVPELRRLAEREPERFSPNVALRPVLQDRLFPTLAYVAGPGELAYFAQLQGVYELFGVPMPIILPRASFTLLEPRVAQLLERFGLELPDLVPEPEQLASRVLRAQLPADFEATLGRAREGVDAIFRGVGESIARVDPTLKATVGQAAGHVKGHLEQLERKAVQALKRREAESGRQLVRVRQALMPAGRLQERVFPLLPYLARYGRGLLASLRAQVEGPGWNHQVIPLQGEASPEEARRP